MHRSLFVLTAAVVACGTRESSSALSPEPSEGLVSGVPNGSLHGQRLFPDDNWWNTDISADPVDPNSSTLISSCGNVGLHADFGTVWAGAPNGIPYILVKAGQKKVPITFTWSSESDPGPYPVPKTAPIEGGANGTGDRHVIVLDVDNKKLYEMYNAWPQNGGASWKADAGAVFDAASNALRPMYWTSADAAGLPIFPGLVRYDEAVELGRIEHALRFTCPHTRKAFVDPARHYASSNPSSSLPPMGMRVRLKAAFNISGFPPEVQVILTAMKKYGMFLADNGSSWYVSGAPDSRWSDSNLSALRNVPSSAFEVVRMAPMHF
jgi:hypothetical protein